MFDRIIEAIQIFLAIATLLGAAWGIFYKWHGVEEQLMLHRQELTDSKEENKLLLKSQLAVAIRLKETGANGSIQEVIDDINEYLMEGRQKDGKND